MASCTPVCLGSAGDLISGCCSPLRMRIAKRSTSYITNFSYRHSLFEQSHCFFFLPFLAAIEMLSFHLLQPSSNKCYICDSTGSRLVNCFICPCIEVMSRFPCHPASMSCVRQSHLHFVCFFLCFPSYISHIPTHPQGSLLDDLKLLLYRSLRREPAALDPISHHSHLSYSHDVSTTHALQHNSPT